MRSAVTHPLGGRETPAPGEDPEAAEESLIFV